MLNFQQGSWHARLWQRMHVYDRRWLAFLRVVRDERVRGNSSRQIAKRNQDRFRKGLVSLCPYFWSNVFGVVAYLPFVYLVRPVSELLFTFFGRYARAMALIGIGLIGVGITYYNMRDLAERRAAAILGQIEQAHNELLYENRRSLEAIADEQYRQEHRAEIEAAEKARAEEDRRLVQEELLRTRLYEALHVQSRLAEWPTRHDHFDHVQGEMIYWNFDVRQPVRGFGHDVLGLVVGIGMFLLLFVGVGVAAVLVTGIAFIPLLGIAFIGEQIGKTQRWQSFSKTVVETWQLISQFIKYRYREHLCPYITFRNGGESHG